MTAHAYCWASGEIGIDTRVPQGARSLRLCGTEKQVRTFVERVARHAYDGVTFLVPGVPEAPNQSAASNAVIRFCAQINSAAVAEGLRS